MVHHVQSIQYLHFSRTAKLMFILANINVYNVQHFKAVFMLPRRGISPKMLIMVKLIEKYN